MQLKIDTHVHTVNSKDGHTSIGLLPRILKAKGLDGIVVTDHDQVTIIDTDEYITIPGIEVTTSEGHLIGLGVEKPVGKGTSTEEAIDLIHQQAGLAVIAHPYDIISNNIDPRRYGSKVEAVETINASEISLFKPRRELDEIIYEYELARLGGSDSHIPQTIGDAYTEIDTPSTSLDDVLEAIRRGRTRPCGRSTYIPYRILKLILDGFKVV